MLQLNQEGTTRAARAPARPTDPAGETRNQAASLLPLDAVQASGTRKIRKPAWATDAAVPAIMTNEAAGPLDFME